jgi:hypothetical protein
MTLTTVSGTMPHWAHTSVGHLVPEDHRAVRQASETAKVANKLVVIDGAGHGFNPKQNQELLLPAMLEWFEKNLAEMKGK